MDKKELQEFLKIKGEIRGVTFETDVKYVVSKWGDEGLERLMKRAKEMGIDLPYKSAETMNWYPLGLRTVSLLLIKDEFNLDDEQIKDMGRMAPHFSFIAKFLFSLFLPLKIFTKDVPRFWKEHYTVGKMVVMESNEEKKIIIVNLEDVELPPVLFTYLNGYLESVCNFFYSNCICTATQSSKSKAENIYQYVFKW
ncbi:MAG: hypothetical protein ABIF89_00075 [bacterium]